PFDYLFFLMIRRPPRSTLFPYTTPSDLTGEIGWLQIALDGLPRLDGVQRPRSEEHTSELQSPMYLVCRLLLEKKAKERIAAREFATPRPRSLCPCWRNIIPCAPSRKSMARRTMASYSSFFLMTRGPRRFTLFPPASPSR